MHVILFNLRNNGSESDCIAPIKQISRFTRNDLHMTLGISHCSVCPADADHRLPRAKRPVCPAALCCLQIRPVVGPSPCGILEGTLTTWSPTPPTPHASPRIASLWSLET